MATGTRAKLTSTTDDSADPAEVLTLKIALLEKEREIREFDLKVKKEELAIRKEEAAIEQAKLAETAALEQKKAEDAMALEERKLLIAKQKELDALEIIARRRDLGLPYDLGQCDSTVKITNDDINITADNNEDNASITKAYILLGRQMVKKLRIPL
jgi:hypothetical protein